MTRKHDGKSKLSSAGANSDSRASGERASWAFWAGWHAAQEAETYHGCKVENLPQEAKERAFFVWAQRDWETETRDQGVDELHPGDAGQEAP
jgi:hypothetical protein